MNASGNSVPFSRWKARMEEASRFCREFGRRIGSCRFSGRVNNVFTGILVFMNVARGIEKSSLFNVSRLENEFTR